MTTRGKLIVLEGGEGTGKTSVVDFLKQELSGQDVLFSREPGGTKLAEEIRGILLSKRDEVVYSETEILLFYAGRMQHVHNVILPSLKQGRHVILDRYFLSTIAYQIFGREKQNLLSFCELLNSHIVWSCIPDLSILLDCAPEIGLARRRKQSGEENLTRFDAETLDFHKRLCEGFKISIQKYPHVVVNTGLSSEEKVKSEVLAHVRRLLK